jgi:hypothetical protein
MEMRDLRVFHHRGFYLGLLAVSFPRSRAIQPQWAWSHDGQSWIPTGVACISLGDEGTFDSREISSGTVTATDDEVIWNYSNGSGLTGRATLPRKELDAWLNTLPQP